MCFEFEALYWAKIAEEELKKKEEEQKRKEQAAAKGDQRKPQPMDEPVPV
ncbi:MAG TPA: hypothetical protein VNM24_14995 [Burkholderiales bacterium]|jgi:hypothetical protein|nr:hypothetical protein [Burkholderiales bacterium]